MKGVSVSNRENSLHKRAKSIPYQVHNDDITDFGFSTLLFYLTINKKQAIRHHLVACDIMDYERRRFTTVAANKQALNRTVKIKFGGRVKMLKSFPFHENFMCLYPDNFNTLRYHYKRNYHTNNPRGE